MSKATVYLVQRQLTFYTGAVLLLPILATTERAVMKQSIANEKAGLEGLGGVRVLVPAGVEISSGRPKIHETDVGWLFGTLGLKDVSVACAEMQLAGLVQVPPGRIIQ